MDGDVEVLDHGFFVTVCEEISSVFQKLNISSDFSDDFSFVGVEMLKFRDVLEEDHELGVLFHD